MAYEPYIVMFLLYMGVVGAISAYIFRLRSSIDEMHGMMIGMTFGMTTGLVTATLYLLPTGDFLTGVFVGSVVGLVFGIPFGKLGGHLGIMEGTMAGPMGGMMGAMVGQMIRPFNIDIFVPFFTGIFLITMIAITYAVNCRAQCCAEGDMSKSYHGSRQMVSGMFILLWTFVSIFLVLMSVIFSFSAGSSAPQATGSLVSAQTRNDVRLPRYLQELTKEEKTEAVMNGDYQEAELRVTSSRYSPNVIVARKNVPLRIYVTADENAGCGREIVFPDFNIDKIVPAGGKETITLNPTNEGEFKFRCSMDMMRGRLVVV